MHYLLFFVLLAFVPQALDARIIDVPEDRETIQGAINIAGDRDTILVQPGRYTESIFEGDDDGFINTGGRRITIGSLYLTTREDHYIRETIIDGEGENRCIGFLNDEGPGTKLVGFTITGGARNYGAGIYILGASPTLSHLVITGNTGIRVDDRGGYGAGIYVSTRDDQEIAEPVLMNCTITDNHGEGGRGGLHFYRNATPILINCIHWNNHEEEQNDVSIISDGLDITYSDIQDGYDGQGNIDDDPDFADPDDGNFALTENSPCVDAGHPDAEEDIDGTRADIGAMIFAQTPSIGINVGELNFGELNVGLSGELTAVISGRGVVPLLIEEIFIDPNDQPFEIIEGAGEHELQEGERFDLTVRFSPQEQGDYEATLFIINNDPENGEAEIPLSGEGLPPVPEISYEPDFIAFDEVTLWETVEGEVTIRNTGAAELLVHDMAFEGDEHGVFSVDFEGEVAIAPDAMRTFNVTFMPSQLIEFNASLIIDHNDASQDVIDIRITGEGTLPRSHYEFSENTGVNHTILVLEALIEGELPHIGSEIAVFSDDGLCCGAEFFIEGEVGFPAWGDNEMTEEIDGFRNNETINFRIWDPMLGDEFPAVPEFVRGQGNFRADGVSVVNLTNGDAPIEDEFELQLAGSWNMVSIPLIMEETHVPNMCRPLVENESLLMVKDHNGRFYAPAFNFCNIPFWDYHLGYQVKMEEADQIVFSGEFVAEDEPTRLREGWSIVAYFPQEATEAPVAFANIVDNLQIAKDAVGHFYLPDFGFNNMDPLHRGGGYQVQVHEALEFVWNTDEQLAAVSVQEKQSPSHFPNAIITGSNMSLLIDCTADLPQGSEIAAFISNGLCIGSAVLESNAMTGLAIWGDDESTETVDGAAQDEAMIFKIFVDGREMNASPVWKQGSNRYITDSFGRITLTNENITPDAFEISSVYPNPFNNVAKIRFTVPHVSPVTVTVHDLNGRIVETLADKEFQTGFHTLSWVATAVPSGTYLVNVTGSEQTLTEKLLLIK